jgi:hypothetical protein
MNSVFQNSFRMALIEPSRRDLAPLPPFQMSLAGLCCVQVRNQHITSVHGRDGTADEFRLPEQFPDGIDRGVSRAVHL